MLCSGQYLLLQAPAGALSWTWGNGVQAQMISTDSTGTYILNASFLGDGSNAVVNGDFSAGISEFTSDLQVGTDGPWGPLSLEGTYGVTTDPALLHTNFMACSDHTGVGGNMLVVNGSAVPGANLWCQSVTVQPNTTYAFSAWVASVRPENPAVMNFSVNGQNLGTPLLATATTCEWLEFYALWNSGSASSATICINNQNLLGDGNDFALDDITFSPMCAFTDSVHVTILPAAPQIVLSGGGALCPGATAEINAQLDPAGWPLNDVVWSWSNGDTGPTTLAEGPGEYTVTASGRCLQDEASVTFGLDTCSSEISMPNVFTPNGDGVNDTFGPILIGNPDSFTMEIRNRWGQLLYATSNVHNRWNGRNEGGPVPAGTYYWNVKYTVRDADGAVHQRDQAGHVTLLDAR